MRRLLAVLALAGGAPAADARVAEWSRTPIAVVLEVGVEQQVVFPGRASVGVPADVLDSGALEVQFANETAYWRAAAPFPRRRVVARIEATGEFVLFDVQAVPTYGATPAAAELIEVVVARPESSPRTPARSPGEDVRVGVVGLIRHAARVDEAPGRLATPPAGLVGVDMAVRDVTALYGHADRGLVTLTARRQWSAGGLFVTAIEAVNWAEEPLVLDVRHLARRAGAVRSGVAGDGFLAVGAVRYRLEPAGYARSTTSLYVVTSGPFDGEAAP